MNHSSILSVCSIWLAAITAAGVSHFVSVQQIVTALNPGLPLMCAPAALPSPQFAGHQETPSPPRAEMPTLRAPREPRSASRQPDALDPQRKFYEELLGEVRNLRHENRNLLDQLGETNRDLMKLEFRVDTHSESFRPLPIVEDRADTSYEDGLGVLPPLDEPYLPLAE